MKIVTINVPERYLVALEKLSNIYGCSRSELIRVAIREQLKRDLTLVSIFEKLSPEFKKEQERRRKILKKQKMRRLLERKIQMENEFYSFCIVCDNKLHSKKKPFNHKGVKIFELRFCCRCYKKFEGKTLDELPDHVIKKIRRKLKKYNRRRFSV